MKCNVGIERFTSESRALTNLIERAFAAIMISRWENTLDDKKLHDALHGQGTAGIIEQ